MPRTLLNLFLAHLKSILRPLLRIHPYGEALVRHMLFQLWRLKARLISRSKRLDVNQTHWINPRRIQFALSDSHFNKYDDIGKIIGGSWDLELVQFTDTDIYQALHAHFIDAHPWESTPFYHRVLAEIDTGRVKWGCTAKSDFDARLASLDMLFHDIKENGYKAQHELFERDFPGLPSLESIDEIAVRVGRHGDLLLQDGRHRLAIAQLLNLSEVPIKITARHSEWYQFRKEILTYARANRNKVYHPLTHIDLRDIPHEHGERRFETLKPYLPPRKGALLDLGAHWGYFCHKCEAEGFRCYAIENDIGNLYFLKRLRRAENRRFEVIEESILKYRTETNFSVVLALNIFHHFTKYEETYYQLIDCLRNLNMDLMFFEPHLPRERQMETAFRNYGHDEFVEFILIHSRLNHSRIIDKAEDGRPLFILYK